MAYRSTKARITGKIKSGGFNQPDNTLAKAINTGAGIMSQGILKKAEEDRIEAREKKKLAAARARSHAAAQAKKEEAARKQQRATLAIAASVGVDPKNTAAVNAIALDVEVFGAGGAMTKVTKDFEDGKFQTPNIDVLGPETQGPDLPSNSTVSVAGLDNPVAIDDLEATSKEMLLSQETRDSAKQQMAITSSVSEIEPEVVGQTQGFKFDPLAKKSKIDWTNVSEAQVKNLQRQEDSGEGNLSPEDQAMLAVFVSDYAEGEKVAAAEKARLERRDLNGKGDPEILAISRATEGDYTQAEINEAKRIYQVRVSQGKIIDWLSADEGTIQNIRRLHDAKTRLLNEEELKVLELYESDFSAAKTAQVAADNVGVTRKVLSMGEDDLLGVINSDTSIYPAETKALAQDLYNQKVTIRQNGENTTRDKEALSSALARLNAMSDMTAEEQQNIIAALEVLSRNSPEAQVMLEVARAMTAGSAADLKTYFSGVTTVEGIEGKIKLAEINLTGEARTTALKGLNELLVDRRKDKKDLSLTDQVILGSVTINGISVRDAFTLTASGDLYSVSQGKTYKTSEVTDRISENSQEALEKGATQLQSAVFAPMLTQRDGVQSLLSQAKRIDDLVKSSDGKVLTFIGGRATGLIQRIMSEYGSYSAFVKSTTKDDLLRYVKEDMPDNATLEKIGVSADQYARFNSQALEFAFTYARTALGQERTTDNDFKYAYNIVTAGSGYPTYTKSLRGLTTEGVKRAGISHDKFLDQPGLILALERPGAAKAYSGMNKTLGDYLKDKGPEVAAQLAWASGEGMSTQDTATGTGDVIATPASVSANLNTYLGGTTFNEDKATYEKVPADDRAMYLGLLSKQLNIPVGLLQQKFEEQK